MKKGLTLFVVCFAFYLQTYSQCGNGSTGSACSSFSATYIADITTVGTATIGTWYNVNTTNLNKPYWVFKNVTKGTIIRLASCTRRDAEFAVSGPSGFTNIYRDGDVEITGLGCTPNGNDESMYLFCTQTGDYNVSLNQNGCVNFTSPTTTNLYWNVVNRPCTGSPSYGSGVWNGYVYDGTGPDYFYGSIGTQTANDINVSWGTSQPITSGTCGVMCDADNFSTEWFMNQTYSDGVYVFSTPGNDDGRVLSNNGGSSWNLINDWGATAGTSTTAPIAMNGNYNMVFYQRENGGGAAARLTTCISMFYKAFDSEKVSMSKIRMALAQFLRSITSFDTRIDQSYKQASEYMNKGHSQAETVKYLFGFSDKTISVLSMCERCHSTITYGNIKMKNNGLDLQYQDIGLAKLTSKKEDIGVFKAPSFRNLKYTAPYMHDGRFKTLEEVIEHYNNGILPHENLDPILKDSLGNPIKLGLGELEKKTNPFVYNGITKYFVERGLNFQNRIIHLS